MNSEDKKRFERYRKGYIPKNEDETVSGSVSNNILYSYDGIDYYKNVLITDIITTNKSSKTK